MTFQRNIIKSCCGSSNLILTTDKPIRKSQVRVFRDNGFFIPENFFQSGILYVQKGTLIATASFGSTRINVRCSGADCESMMKSFEILLEQAISL